MKTQLLSDVRTAAQILRAGGLVAFATETVFGLGADATNPAAIDRLFRAKGRPQDNPLIVHVADHQRWQLAASKMTEQAELLLRSFSPGPITVVLPKSDKIGESVTAGLSTVGLRIPAHALAREFLSACNVPIAAPSANRSGKPSATTWQAVLEDLDGEIDAILLGEPCGIGLESTVVNCTGDVPVVLRTGAITLEQLQAVAPETQQITSLASGGPLPSPGLRYAHYQPAAKVSLVRSTAEVAAFTQEVLSASGYCGLSALNAGSSVGLLRVFPSTEAYARGFYEFLREADRVGLANVFVELAPNSGIGVALRDRQQRAAAGETH
ncbi:MAG: threonylcarbamoyl-AMP synthase [Planctomycetales bacterium]|nr:threonylcarbamoyl-AMP synthase [Planctomycetales bacterium]